MYIDTLTHTPSHLAFQQKTIFQKKSAEKPSVLIIMDLELVF